MAGAVLSAESEPNSYTGDIVNARCVRAAPIVSRNSRGYVPNSATAFAGSRYKPINTPGLRKSILRHCAVNPGITEFALLDDQGNFFKLDETGNFKVLSQTTSATKKVRVTISGSVDRDTLKVESLSRF
jgi:hypothetical protein